MLSALGFSKISVAFHLSLVPMGQGTCFHCYSLKISSWKCRYLLEVAYRWILCIHPVYLLIEEFSISIFAIIYV